MRKRWSFWETREEFFNKQPSLFVIKEGHAVLNEEQVEKIYSIFWSLDICSTSDINVEPTANNFRQFGNTLTVQMAYR